MFRITADDIETPYLKAIFNGESQKALDLLNATRAENIWEGKYEYDIILAFWLAIQKEDIQVAAHLINFDLQLRYIATLAFYRKKECKYDKTPPISKFKN